MACFTNCDATLFAFRDGHDFEPEKQMDGAGIGTAAIGAVFGSVLGIVKEVAITAYLFTSELNLIKERLISLKPKIDLIAKSNLDLNRSDDTKMFIDQLKAGEELVLKCSKIKPWELRRRFIYSMRLSDFQNQLLWFFQVDVQALLVCNISKLLEGQDDLSDKMDRMHLIVNEGSSGGYCDVPGLPDFIVGLDKPLKELKGMVLQNGVSVVVLSAPGGSGKTTLSKMLCKDKEIQGIYGNNTFFVTVSRTASIKDIIQDIFQHRGLPQPRFRNEEDAINQLEILMRRLVQGILLVLDDVWSEWESLIEKFKFGIDNYKILVTSRFVFPRFPHTYKLNILNNKDAMTLFCHSAFRNDDRSKIPEELLNKIVEVCKGFPLALTVIGRSLYGKHLVIWDQSAEKWSKGESILYSDEQALLMILQPSLDALDEKPIAKECYLDLGSFPQDQKIAATVLMDMWIELYGQDDEGADTLGNLLELSFRNLVNLFLSRSRWGGVTSGKGTIEVDGYCNEHYVMQHDLLRELINSRSDQEPIEQRKRVIMNISENVPPQWLVEQRQQPKHARLLSISTDEKFASSWYNMQAPSTEVLILNFRSKNYVLPHFVETMNKLKVLIITNYGFCPEELKNFILLGYLSDLRRIRLENISIPYLSKSLLQLRNLQKISLMMCEIGKAFGSCSSEIPQMLPNLLEIEIDYCNDLVEFPIGFCNLLRLKKLSITYCNELSELPNGFGRLVNLEVLRVHSCMKLEELPESICGLHKLRYLDISDCVGLNKMPERIGDLQGLRVLHMRGCHGLKDLPPSVEDLCELKDVICDEEISYLWKFYENSLTNLTVNVIAKDINLGWLHNVV
ncbi:hypothetical protein LguiA_017496 [Lonicera macranthoides]